MQARGWLLDRISAAGLTSRVDAAGNILGRWEQGSPAVLVGSHLDSVPNGGALDGALGVLAGVKARHVASGGIGGSEGAVVLLLEGYEENIEKAWQVVSSVKGESPIAVPRHSYSG